MGHWKKVMGRWKKVMWNLAMAQSFVHICIICIVCKWHEAELNLTKLSVNDIFSQEAHWVSNWAYWSSASAFHSPSPSDIEDSPNQL